MIKSFTNAVKEMTQHKEGCYHWWLGTDNNGNNWAIVLGWKDGYEEDGFKYIRSLNKTEQKKSKLQFA